MNGIKRADPLARKVSRVQTSFAEWLDVYGETSLDHQSFFAGPVGGRAKSFYYRNRLIGTAAVAPMIFFEAFLPSARRLFHHPIRFPIADAHYAMGFAFLYEATENPGYLERAVHFLDELRTSRCSDFKEYCWGYPFDWVTRGGIIKRQTPLITTTPYVYEAFLQVYALDPKVEWRRILESIARHACVDIKDFMTSANASSCSYTPFGEGGVINAAAYRAFLLTSASRFFSNDDYWKIAERNLNFVLEAQNRDGSWYYARDGVRDFVDHYHTCFVMKALAKIHALTGHEACLEALSKGVTYYLNNLFAEDGLPKPFSKAPRLTVYQHELYDCAECINLCVLLRDRFPRLKTTLETVVREILENWVKRDGSFRSRRLHLGWDNVPMHRWGQSQMFRSLAFYLSQESKTPADNLRVVRTDIPFSAEQQKVVDRHFQSHVAQWKEVYEEASAEGAIYRERLKVVMRWVDELAMPPGQRILEIGCGGGVSVVALAQRGYFVQATDSVAEMLNSTRESAARAGVNSSVLTSLGDAHSLAFPENAFGLVLAIGVIPYLHSPKKALGEMSRVLRPGGFLLVTVANRARLDYALDPWLCPAMQPAKRIVRAIVRRFRGSRSGPTGPPLRLGSLRELEGWLSSVGLAKVKAKTVGFQPFFRYRRFFAERNSIRLNCWLQWLADHNVPGIRSTGMDYIVLARKEWAEARPSKAAGLQG